MAAVLNSPPVCQGKQIIRAEKATISMAVHPPLSLLPQLADDDAGERRITGPERNALNAEAALAADEL